MQSGRERIGRAADSRSRHRHRRVLAIAAARALHRHVLATDIDAAAVRVARDNARLNRVGPMVEFVTANGVTATAIHARAPFDLVFANILLGPLQRLAAPLGKIVAPGGRIVLSGILNAQANAALAAYRALGAGTADRDRRLDHAGAEAPPLRAFHRCPRVATAHRLAVMFEAHFQSFEDRGERSASAARLAALRAELKRRGLDGFIVPRADRYQNEYVPPCAERLAWLTGFTGSAGAAIVLNDRAAIFVDGRYLVQVREEVDAAAFAVEHLVDHPPAVWIEENLPAGAKLGYSPWLHTVDGAERLAKACATAGASLVAVDDNPIDACWTDRPPPPLGAVVLHDLRYAGEDGRGEARAAFAPRSKNFTPTRWWCPIRMRCPGCSTSVAATCRIRRSRSLSPWCRSRSGRRSISTAASSTTMSAIVSKTIADVRADADFERDLAALGKAQGAVRLDPAACPEAIARLVTDNGGKVLRGGDPITPMKAVKNAAEIAGARAAQRRDGAAVTRFLAWFDREAPRGLTEIDAVEALESFRRDTGLLKDVSFPTIAGAGADGAIVHYRVSRRSNRRIAPGELFLIDSGGQYEDGTTDITRTVAVGAPSAEMRKNFTLVLKGHIAIARAVFPDGTSGAQLDTLGAAILVATRPRFRSRHRPRRRQLSVGA